MTQIKIYQCEAYLLELSMNNEEKRSKFPESSKVPFLHLVYYFEVREISLELPILLKKKKSPP